MYLLSDSLIGTVLYRCGIGYYAQKEWTAHALRRLLSGQGCYYKTAAVTHRQAGVAARRGGLLAVLGHTHLHGALARGRPGAPVLVAPVVSCQVDVVCVVNFDENVACLRRDLEQAFL